MNSVNYNGKKVYPSKVVCIGRNYVEHIKELGNETPDEPVIFIKPNSSISDEIFSGDKDGIHYESEISFIVEKNRIKAVGFGLDLTKRDIQSHLKKKGLPWERAKAFDKSAVFSEFVAIVDGISSISIELSINDEMVQKGGYQLMIYKPEEIIEEVCKFITFEDFDVLMTGTPKGVGPLKRSDKFSGRIIQNGKTLIEREWIVR